MKNQIIKIALFLVTSLVASNVFSAEDVAANDKKYIIVCQGKKNRVWHSPQVLPDKFVAELNGAQSPTDRNDIIARACNIWTHENSSNYWLIDYNKYSNFSS